MNLNLNLNSPNLKLNWPALAGRATAVLAICLTLVGCALYLGEKLDRQAAPFGATLPQLELIADNCPATVVPENVALLTRGQAAQLVSLCSEKSANRLRAVLDLQPQRAVTVAALPR